MSSRKCFTCKVERAKYTCNAVPYCGKPCAEIGWALIEGQKRPREEKPKKKTNVYNDALAMKVFHTMKNTPEMLENLANTLTIEQMRNLKYNKFFHESIWKNSNFWYYVIKRFRPELAPGPFNVHMAYKRIAMRRIIAPDQTIQEPRDMDPMLRRVLQIMMTNSAAVDSLLQTVSVRDIIAWSNVSVDFRNIVSNSNVFWYKLYYQYRNWTREGEQDDNQSPYNYRVDYQSLLREENPMLFKTVLNIDLRLEHGVELTCDFDGKITLMDIYKAGGLEQAIDRIDRCIVTHEEPNDFVKIAWQYNKGDWGDSLIDDDVTTIWEALLEYNTAENMMMMFHEGETIDFYFNVEIISPETVTLSIHYPEDIAPYFYNSHTRTWINSLFEPRVGKDRDLVIEENYPYFEDETMSFGSNVTPLDEVDLTLPAYFTLYGDTQPIDMDSWGEILVNDELVRFERLEEKIRKNLLEKKDVEVIIRPL